ncbi:hypothetical protein H6F96_20635 [Microcoleus sp. FACHB-53]|nr:hypothetical protein [Microcoleus sp. FACHB-53]MBD2129279.1 hypothetical protein [Microcoleus sp. FACHB-1]
MQHWLRLGLPVSFAVATLGTIYEFGTKPDDGLTQRLWSYDLYPLWGTQAATRLPQVVLFLIRHAYLGITAIANQPGLASFLAPMFLRQES